MIYRAEIQDILIKIFYLVLILPVRGLQPEEIKMQAHHGFYKIITVTFLTAVVVSPLHGMATRNKRLDDMRQASPADQPPGSSEGGVRADEHKDVSSSGVVFSTSGIANNAFKDVSSTSGGISSHDPQFNERRDTVNALQQPVDFEDYIPVCSDKKYEQKFDFRINGFVNYLAFVDTRQPIQLFSGLILLAPKPPLCDPAGRDINAAPDANMLALESRFDIAITGPRLGHAYTSACISFDLWDPIVNSLFRMRFFYMQFDWQYSDVESARLLLGQFYHPLSIEEIFAETLSPSQGVLYDPFTFAPQATYTYNYDNFYVTASLNYEYFVFALNIDDEGVFSPEDIVAGGRNAVIPSMYLGCKVRFCEQNFVGAGVDYHRNVPHLITAAGYATTKGVNSWLGYLFAVIKHEGFTAKFRITGAQNGFRYFMLGGWGLRADGFNPLTQEGEYTNLNAWAFWSEWIYRYKKGEFGVFFGYTKNLGSQEALVTLPDGSVNIVFMRTFYQEAKFTDFVFKFQPRIKFYVDPIIFGLELEYCQANYGSISTFGRIINSQPVTDARMLFSIYYNF